MSYKNHLISIIKSLSIDLDEVIVDISLEEITFNSIEWVRPNKLILHVFSGDFDIEYDYDDLDSITKKEIYLFFLKNFITP